MPEEIIGEVLAGAIEIAASSDSDNPKKGCGCLFFILIFCLISFGIYYLLITY